MQPTDQMPPQPEVPVVGMGYSAGGLEAARTILSLFPPNAGLAIVVVQHLQSGYESHLAEILAKSSPMPVRTIENGILIEANTVYVIPPAFDVVLNGNFLNLNPKKGESRGHHFEIDFFFASLSQNRKSKAIGILLSGAGADGTIGLKAIKAEGGITIVQDPKTAKFDGMPRSAIASGIADLILPPEAIASELARLAKHPYTMTALQAHEDSVRAPEVSFRVDEEPSLMDKVLKILFEQTKIDFSLYKPSTIRRRIERQMMLRKIETIDKYAEHLQKNTDEVKALYEDIFIHVTDFFRDPETFEALRERVFPELIKGKTTDLPIRIWVPGCATGEEAYSLAISLTEFLEKSGLKIPINVFASDISEPALQKARKGFYAENQMTNLSPERLERFFEKSNGGYKISKQIRDLCIFSRHDVTSNPPIPRVELISCRNVLIYFSSTLQKRLFPVFHYALTDSGFLWLGRAENPETSSKLFVAVDKAHKIFAKTRGTFAQQQRFMTPSYATSAVELPSAIPTHLSTRPGDMARNADQLILYRYSPPSVLINPEAEILQFRGRTVPYLEPSPGLASHSLLKMANPDIAAPLRACIQAAKSQNAQSRKEDIEFEFEGQIRKVNIDVSPLNPSASEPERQYLVVFEDAAAAKIVKSKIKPTPTNKPGGKDTHAQIETLLQQNSQIRQELDVAREYQHSLIEEYESSQEELTSANEELRSTNEELQSTNEELHSTNEELGSAKEELQSANEELLSTNEEVQKRNLELESALKEVDSGERRFRLMVDSVKDYAIFMLDPQGNVATWNEGARRIKGYETQEIVGQHFSRFYPEEEKLKKPPIEIAEAARLGRFEEEGWRVRKDGSRFWADVTLTRLNDMNGGLIGFAKVTRDLTERKKVEELKNEEQRQLAILEQVKEREGVLDQLFSESPSFMALLSVPDYRFLRSNSEHLKLIRKTDILGKTVKEVEPELQAQGIIDLLDSVVRTGKPFVGKEIEVQYDAVGREPAKTVYLDFVYQPLRKPSGEIYAVAAQGYDVTEKVLSRRSVENSKLAIENERENFRNLFKQTPEMVCILSGPEHLFEFANEAHVRVLGFNATGMTVRRAQPESTEVHGILDEVYRTGKTAELHEIPVTVTGRLRYFNLTYAARRDDHGEINGIMILGTEITEQVTSRGALEKAIQARDEFLSIASHELKTPITSLQIQAQLRKRNAVKENADAFTFEKLRKMFDGDKAQIERLTALIDDMLDVTRIASNKLALRLEQADLKTLLAEVLERLSPQFASVGCSINVGKLDSCPGFFDHFRIEQVVVNLLTNAIRYGAGKPVYIALTKEGKTAILTVRDEGIGIAEADQERIFQRFERATRTSAGTGLGLGLYITKQIVEAHQGKIRVESELDHGSCFHVELPLRDSDL